MILKRKPEKKAGGDCPSPPRSPVASWGQCHTCGTGVTKIKLEHPDHGTLESFEVVRQTNSGCDLDAMIDILNAYQAEREAFYAILVNATTHSPQ